MIGVGNVPAADAKTTVDRTASDVAMSMWLGVALDGIPEALMLGFLVREGDGSVSWSLIAGIFIANFPEAFSAAAMLQRGGMAKVKIIAMWSVHSTMTSCAPMIFHRTESVLPPVSHSCHEGKNWT